MKYEWLKFGSFAIFPIPEFVFDKLNNRKINWNDWSKITSFFCHWCAIWFPTIYDSLNCFYNKYFCVYMYGWVGVCVCIDLNLWRHDIIINLLRFGLLILNCLMHFLRRSQIDCKLLFCGCRLWIILQFLLFNFFDTFGILLEWCGQSIC